MIEVSELVKMSDEEIIQKLPECDPSVLELTLRKLNEGG